jgi:2-oxoglutarate ferredoxin oxidoreductase subunit alpha
LTELSVWIGGAAGDGIASAGESLAKALMREGFKIFAYNSYQSVIRGGHVRMQIRIGRDQPRSHGERCHILLALNSDTVTRYAECVQPGGAVLFDANRVNVAPEMFGERVQLCGLPVSELVDAPLLQNTVALGGLAWLLHLDATYLKGVVSDRFRGKGEEVTAANIEAIDRGIAYAQSHFRRPTSRLARPVGGKRRLLLSGNEAVGFGALAAGCQFYAAYPMTPASSLLHWLANHAREAGCRVKQCEDEIAAVNMAIGASHAGARAMTGTSGGGFALMTEAVGQAAMTETPVVIVAVQRGGPSTGLPTKTEQADLFQMIGASQGDFPKIILAPRSVEECFYVTQEAFNLAERYQCPVIISSDFYLAEHLETIDGLDLERVPIERGELVTEWTSAEAYRRYRDTSSGVSPRALPGTAGARYVAATDEHDEDGALISDVFTDPKKRARMMEKRMRKLTGILSELPPPALEGPAEVPLTLVGWGSTCQVLREVMDEMNAEGPVLNLLAIRNLWPFQGDAVAEILERCSMTLAVEGSFSGQLARLVRMETGIAIPHHLRKYDGEPFEPGQILTQVRRLLMECPQAPTVTAVVSGEARPEQTQVPFPDEVFPRG